MPRSTAQESSRCPAIFGGDGFQKTAWLLPTLLGVAFLWTWSLLALFGLTGVAARVYFNVLFTGCVAFIALVTYIFIKWFVMDPAIEDLTQSGGVDRGEFIQAETMLFAANDARVFLIMTTWVLIGIVALGVTEAALAYPFGYQGTVVKDTVVTFLGEEYESGMIRAFVFQSLSNAILFISTNILLGLFFVPWGYGTYHLANVYALSGLGEGQKFAGEGDTLALKSLNPIKSYAAHAARGPAPARA